ncbi:hypothetical protein scyTo_0012778 [Scyliorhinus torazame]|uniref:Uncharacterized protein n=1 Tax=Scyliorhinus torazame TaxID=75743 RepID=A0A401NIE2_SCYTO|nr:hypothetical protein [Scyliorhinus torazame]
MVIHNLRVNNNLKYHRKYYFKDNVPPGVNPGVKKHVRVGPGGVQRRSWQAKVTADCSQNGDLLSPSPFASTVK